MMDSRTECRVCPVPEAKDRMLVFDVDDTMYDLMWPFHKAYERVLADRTTAECEELFLRSRINSDIVLEKEKQGLIKPEDAFYQRMKMTCEDVGISITREACEVFEKEYRYFQTRIELFDFMKEILDFCRENEIPIALLTNGNRKDQGRKLSVLHLERWFEEDKMFISGEIGHHKPDVRVFQKVQERLAIQPEETWYIGDSYESDMVGAHRAGWHTIWLNHRRRKCPDSKSLAEIEVKSGEDLLRLLKVLKIEMKKILM